MDLIKQFETISERELILKITQGEMALFEVLIRRNNPYLYKVGMSYGYNHQDVEDLMQEAFIAAYQHLEKFEHRSSFKTWVIRIMINQCYKKSQKMSYKKEPVMDTWNIFENQPSPDAHKAIVNRELSHVIENALMQLPLDYRMVFSLRELNGLSTQEAAEALGITESNVKVRLNRARHMLRKHMEAMYSPEDIFEFNLIYCNNVVNGVMKAITCYH
jgi:RNA polymerase sigma factor (sigma-70 family)